MVVSKKCKVCSALDEGNIPISGEYFGKNIPGLIEKICGIELDPRKLNGVLLCELCSVMILHTEGYLTKLQKSMFRLKKPKVQKTPKPTPKRDLNDVGSETRRKIAKSRPSLQNADVGFKKISDNSKSLNDLVQMAGKETPKKVDAQKAIANGSPTKNSKRKLDYQDEEFLKILKKESKVASPKKEINHLRKDCSESPIIIKGEENDYGVIESNSEDFQNYMKNELEHKRTKIKQLNCVLCGKTFNQKRLLRDHIEFYHLGEKLKECPHCFMEFRSVQKYESHVFGEKCKSTLFPCQLDSCNKRFKSSLKMEEHMKEKHNSQ